jgi:hypothetical protein
VHIYVNEKTIHIETVPGVEEGGIKENGEGVNASMR